MTLFEIMIVVAIIGLLATLAIPSLMKVRRASQNARFISDMRIAVMAFEQASFAPTGYPGDAAPGVIPAGMTDYLSNMAWTEPTPLGGQWDWEPNMLGFGNAVRVVTTTLNDSQFREIDERIDDGNLATGLFQKMSGGSGYGYLAE